MSEQLQLLEVETVQIEAFRIHCFFQCGFSVTHLSPDESHGHMEAHYEVAHRADLERLLPNGF